MAPDGGRGHRRNQAHGDIAGDGDRRSNARARTELATVTERAPLPVLPVASRTVTLIVWGPLAKPIVSQGIETLAPPVVCVLISVLPTETVNVLDDPLAPLTQITIQTVPVTVAPSPGAVNAIDSVPPAGGGGGAAWLFTVTVIVALALWLAPSSAVTVSVWLPLAIVVVFHV